MKAHLPNITSMGLKIRDGKILVLDQRLLPLKEVWLDCSRPEAMIDAIKTLAVRGAPLIGVAAGLTLASLANEGAELNQILSVAKLLREARPTAVNLMAAIDEIVLSRLPNELTQDLIISRALRFFEEDVLMCENIGIEGAPFLKDGMNVLTHCNAGALATAGIGTAIGVISTAHRQGKKIHVYVSETRPLLQGARLTAWEMKKLGISHTLICDNMAATLMAQNRIDCVIVGADRIAKNGDFANKIGTYSHAISAHHHKIPFYVAAPSTTVDLNCPDGSKIPIEERNHSEVRSTWAEQETPVFNPAFDVTPRHLVTRFFGCDFVQKNS